ncbi:protein translocation protein SEC63 [Kluyveromyces marxianus]|uniref:Protein translocation protein SEC63 n=2 Tax=Kluyveromyces marxianus TaxID=4911 RepID=W0TAB0_KLUMD|nr:protein translocation protein SEC63 [Kluyveromyces marxianus DMKU3-1042]QGN15466.1 protein translocation protein SEC63 [Kluyveromyces marxianus]BAO39751.1 protein translocation protein SEC63 [Kluyveromyces marxianus DMKU3-1042]BAP71235.1 protein translocation protein SEC63 [Kluyveromyces marxianus]
MPQNYDYDETSTTWPFFVLTVLLVCVVPVTCVEIYKLVAGDSSSPDSKSEWARLHEKYTPEEVRKQRLENKKKRSKKGIYFATVGWVLISALVYYIQKNDAIYQIAASTFDPYELLGVSLSSTDKEIKSAYRKLSVKFHPDKLSKDLSESDRSAMEERFVMINKAYKALTDEITKENYKKYGHPDGPQSTSHGIALPKFLVEGSASPFVLFAYFVLLAVVLPVMVAKWWSSSQEYTKHGIHSETASHFVDKLFNFKPSYVVVPDLIIKWISEAKEYQLKYPELTPEDVSNVIHAHINREASKHDYAKNYIITKSSLLFHQLIEIASTFRNTEVALMALETYRSVIQCTQLSLHSQIFQLPNVNKEHFLDSTTDDIRTLGKLFTYPDEQISKILGIQDKEALKETLTVASRIPKLQLLKASFKVRGSSLETVEPGSTPHIQVKVLIRSPKHKLFPKSLIPEEKLLGDDPLMLEQDPFEKMLEEPLLPETFAPLHPTRRRTCWYSIVVSQKDGKIIQTPSITQRLSVENLNVDFDKRIVKDVEKEFKADDWVVGTISVPFAQPAPQDEGSYFFRVVIKSPDYFGSDLDFTVPLVVKRAPVEVDPKKEILHELGSDEEEDDDAQDSAEDEDDSDASDDEYDSDITDIDTDTEDEDEESDASNDAPSPDNEKEVKKD